MPFTSSVVSYPVRGPYGDSHYRGNTCGQIIKDFLETYHPKPASLFCDPAEGSGTSRDVAAEMKVRYQGLDLSRGFNLLRQDLGHTLGQHAQSAFFHPPYYNMIRYSGHVWGQRPHPDDLSQCSSLEEFLSKLQLAVMNIHDAMMPDGHYAILIGTMRKNGQYHDLAALAREQGLPGSLRDVIIKVQHNTQSERTHYSGKSFVPIAHETLLVYRKDSRTLTTLDFAVAFTERLKTAHASSWKNLVKMVFMKSAGKPLTLPEVYSELDGSAKASMNQNWQAKVRQCVQDARMFNRLERGLYELRAAA